jgi:hypothetical protein
MSARTTDGDQESAFAKYARATEPERTAARRRDEATYQRVKREGTIRRLFDDTLQEAARSMSPATFRRRLRRVFDLDS